MPVCTNDVWIVVAAFNEAPRIAKTLAALAPYGWNVVVVNDGSADDTQAIAVQGGAVVLRHLINRGQGASLQTGIDFAVGRGGKWIVTFDADGQHHPADIPAMLDRLAGGQVDIVLGSRFLGNTVDMPFHRYLLLKVAVLFSRITTGLKVTDTHNGLRAMSAVTARRMQIQEDRMAHASEILHNIASLKLRYTEHPVTVRYYRETLAKGQRSGAAWGVLGRLMISRLFT